MVLDPLLFKMKGHQKMVRNYYYLVAGILGILFSITHALSGENNVLPILLQLNDARQTHTTLSYVWHILSAENFFFGITFIYLSLKSPNLNSLPLAKFILILLAIRWLVIVIVIITRNPVELKTIAVDSIAMAIYISLIIFGVRYQRLRYKQLQN